MIDLILLNGNLWSRAQTSYEAVPKGITRIAGLFKHGLLCGTNDNGELLLYAVPLSKACIPVWEEKINAGIGFSRRRFFNDMEVFVEVSFGKV